MIDKAINVGGAEAEERRSTTEFPTRIDLQKGFCRIQRLYLL
jgi:hypothetical protein